MLGMKNPSQPANERQPICSFPNCGRDTLGEGLCNAHLAQKKSGRSLKAVRRQKPRQACCFLGCAREAIAKGLCKTHYYQRKRGKRLCPIFTPRQGCSVEGCARKHAARGYCHYHFGLAAAKTDLFGIQCRVKSCVRPVKIKKYRLCSGHYAQLMRGEKLRPITRAVALVDADGRRKNTEQYLEEYIRRDANGCWVWTGNLSRHGYGLMSAHRMGKKGKVFAHRVAWAVKNGFQVTELPSKLSLDHICRNRACVNPEHLTPMPVADNLSNMFAWHSLQSAKELYEQDCRRLQNEIAQLEAQLISQGRECRG